MDNRLRAYVAEFLGTFVLVFVSAGGVCAAYIPVTPDYPHPSVWGIALAQGCALAAALTATMNVSGGFLNPAITLTLWVFKRLEGPKALGLVAAQILGAVLAGALLRLIFRDEGALNLSHLGTPHLKGFGPLTLGTAFLGVGIELVLTFALTFAIFATILDPRSAKMGGLWVGLTQIALVFMAFDLTGGAANPARWFGTAIWEKTIPSLKADALADHMVYWVGPIIGALLAGGIYGNLILPTANDE